MAELQDNLTDRELEILACMVEGLSNAEIAARLYLASQTVRWYNSQIYSKLDVRNRREAVEQAAALGLFQHDDRAENIIQHNLPAQITPFIGRKSDLQALTERISDEQMRLVTILALGGMGKTRLALQIATQLLQMGQNRFQDGIFFIPLQPLSDPQHIITHIASHVGYKFLDGGLGLRQQLLDYLSEKRLLLVMDNWEHLLDGAILVTEMLNAAPALCILATSREKLNLSGETVYNLKGMQFPDWETPEDALEYDAVQLLVQSAQRVNPDWQVTTDTLNYVARICRITQGMPLGIVLAASWLDILPLKDIAEELQRSIDFLSTDMRDIPDRQHSIRAIFEYSWRQLQPEEQAVFMKLSVFRGGFTRDAAQTICNANIRILQNLVNKALITRTNTNLYEVHELVRQYAAEQLEQTDHAESVHEAHSTYYLNWLNSLEADIKGKRQVAALDEIDADFENVRIAWGYGLEQSHTDLIRNASESLYLYCDMRSRFAEGQALFTQALPIVADDKSLWSRLVLCKHRLIESPAPDDERVKAIAIAEETSNLADMAMGLLIEGRSKWIRQGQFSEALYDFEQAHELYRKLEDEFYVARLINRIGLGHSLQGERIRGLELTEQSADLQRQIGDLSGLGISLNNLIAFNFVIDNYEQSIHLSSENIAVGEQSKNTGNLAFTYGIMSLTYFFGGEFDEARKVATYASKLGHDVGYIQAESLGVATLGLLKIVFDEDYRGGLATSNQALHLADSSNRRLTIWPNGARLLASCGLQQFTDFQHDMSYLLQSEWLSMPAWSLIIGAYAIYYAETQAYEQATRYVSFLLNAERKTFQWVKKCVLLQKLQQALSNQIDKTTFNTLQAEGRQMSLDDITQDIFSNIT